MLNKIAALATIILISTSTFVAAGESERRGLTPEERMDRMQKHLDLSDEQISQIREIHDNGGGREEFGAILTQEQRDKVGKDRGSKERLKRMQKHLDLSDDQLSQIREIRSNGGSREDVAKVLTEEQRSVLKGHHKKNKGGA
jgi:Spy/CpxP family protein refolding chaperone